MASANLKFLLLGPMFIGLLGSISPAVAQFKKYKSPTNYKTEKGSDSDSNSNTDSESSSDSKSDYLLQKCILGSKLQNHELSQNVTLF